MGIREHHGFDTEIMATERLVTAYYVYKYEDPESTWAEEMDFLITPGISQADMNDFATKYGEDNLEPGWVEIQWGQPSCGTVTIL
jgi:hypothetical protein